MRWLRIAAARSIFAITRDAHPGKPFPVAVALGADPATMLGAVTPVPDTLSEYQFAGLLRGARTEIVKCLTHDLQVPASAEIVLEGFIHPDASDRERLRDRARRAVRRSHRLLQRGRALSGVHDRAHHACGATRSITRPTPASRPDEPAVLGVALNEVFVPLLQKQFPEIADFYLPPEGCSYRLAVVA